ncbi:MAG: hypothetical protein ACE5K4_03565 [Candidatus Hydrothermarchaeota archaeon]
MLKSTNQDIDDSVSRLIKDFAACYDVIENMPRLSCNKEQYHFSKSLIEKIGKNLKDYLKRHIDEEKAKRILVEAIEEVKKRREDFGRYEVVPYFRREEMNFLVKLHEWALNFSMVTVLGKKGLLEVSKEDVEDTNFIKEIKIPEDISEEIISEILSKGVEILSHKLKEERKNLIEKKTISEFKHKIRMYDLDQDLWAFFTAIETVRLLDVNSSIVKGLIDSSELMKKLEKLKRDFL